MHYSHECKVVFRRNNFLLLILYLLENN
uniref:Uncharacterized protein n=1 Tax=Heterorhabditis bacteriophora TaxID=37862 RepID=A0A1I7WLT7_HETBA